MGATSVILVVQLLVLVATLPVFFLSRQTSRGRRSQQTSYVALAAVLGLLALFGALMSWLAASSEEDPDLSLALGTPALTLVLCALIVWRALWSHRKHSSKALN